MLCLMDPLLPFSFMMGCLRAYTCPDEELEKKQKRVAQMLNTPRIKSKNHHPFTAGTAGTAIDPKNRRATLEGIRTTVELAQECTETGGLNADSSLATDLSNSVTAADERSSELSDTMASASLNSNYTKSNTEAPTPESLSFEEDSQPIQSFHPSASANGFLNGVKDQMYQGIDSDLNLDDELPSDPTVQYVYDFLDR